jgi:hypothetical protein
VSDTVTHPKIEIGLENVVTLLKTGWPKCVSPMDALDRRIEGVIFREATEYWRKHKLVGYDVSLPEDMGHLAWRNRALDLDDAIVAVVLIKLGITPGPEHFGAEPQEIWPEVKQLMLNLLAGHYGERHAQRVALAARDYFNNGDRYS